MKRDDLERACRLAELAGGGVGITLTAAELRSLMGVEMESEYVDGITRDYLDGLYAELEQLRSVLSAAKRFLDSYDAGDPLNSDKLRAAIRAAEEARDD